MLNRRGDVPIALDGGHVVVALPATVPSHDSMGGATTGGFVPVRDRP